MPRPVVMGVGLVHATSLVLFLVSCYHLCVLSQTPPPGDNGGALSILPQDDQDNEDVTVAEEEPEAQSGDKKDKKTLDVFYPTKEWQTVKPNQAIPRGLHVRLNMQTGEREAKLQEGDNGLPKYWRSGEKEGMVNTDSKQFTRDELKQYLKEFKVNRVDSEDPERAEQIKQKFKSYEEIKKEMAKMEMEIKTEGEIITELVTKLNSTTLTVTDKEHILEELEYYAHKIDNAILLCDLGGMQMMIRSLNDTEPSIRSMSAFAMGSALQSNPKAQVSSVEAGAVQQLIRSLSTERDRAVRKKMLYALSSLMRHFPFAQKRFIELGGLSVLAAMFGEKEPINIKVKVMTLLNDLVIEQNIITDKADSEDTTVKEKIKQYKQVHLKSAIQEQGLCELLPSLLGTYDHDTNEKLLQTMVTLSEMCHVTFYKSRSALENIEAYYSNLSKDTNEDEDLRGYYSDILKSVQHVLSIVSQKAKEEL